MIVLRAYLASGETRWWGTNPTVSAGSDSNNVRVDSTRDAVLHLSVKLWESVSYKSKTNITNYTKISNTQLTTKHNKNH